MNEKECKDLMRPVKRELRNLKDPSSSLTGKEKAKYIKQNLYQVGKHIQGQLVRERSANKRYDLERHLWKFASFFWPMSISSKQYKNLFTKIQESGEFDKSRSKK
jgi:chromodomain-helicase-DNA-binding protein 1